jgi:ribosomal protein S18 acetylase RimI-like enzyme
MGVRVRFNLVEPGFEIRPAQSGDAEAVRELVRSAYAVYVPRIGREPAPMGADYEALIGEGAVSVAAEDDSIVGVLVLRPLRDSLLVENVAVAPDKQRRGIGRALLAFAEQRARELDLSKISLYTNSRMTENLSLYPRLGYIEVGRREEHGFQRVFFEKSLSL